MAIELTLARVKELLAEAVAEKGADYVYTTPEGEPAGPDMETPCRYVHGDKPGCVVGHVLHKAGVSLALLEGQEGTDAYGAMRNLWRDGEIEFEPPVRQLLNHVQLDQDRGTPWGEAVRRALATAEG